MSAHLADPAARLTRPVAAATRVGVPRHRGGASSGARPGAARRRGRLPAGLFTHAPRLAMHALSGRRPRPQRRAPRRGPSPSAPPWPGADVEAVVLASPRTWPPAGDVTAAADGGGHLRAYGDAGGSSRSWRNRAALARRQCGPTAPDRSSTGCPQPAEVVGTSTSSGRLLRRSRVAAATRPRAELSRRSADVLALSYAGRAVVNARRSPSTAWWTTRSPSSPASPHGRASATAAYRRLGALWWAEQSGAGAPTRPLQTRSSTSTATRARPWTVRSRGPRSRCPTCAASTTCSGCWRLAWVIGARTWPGTLGGPARRPRAGARRRGAGAPTRDQLVELDAGDPEADAWSDAAAPSAPRSSTERALVRAGPPTRPGATAAQARPTKRARTAVRKTIAATLARVRRAPTGRPAAA